MSNMQPPPATIAEATLQELTPYQINRCTLKIDKDSEIGRGGYGIVKLGTLTSQSLPPRVVCRRYTQISCDHFRVRRDGRRERRRRLRPSPSGRCTG
ncbi:hypothetical protein FRB94_005155 [Tulasnella sp. JGI-2019a]|nr:hypothetical protein FRB94_005155 [Tulasnella sp. JGI-2019a]